MPISGKEMIKMYKKDGWIVLRKKGSHVVMGKGFERETIPLHGELKKGLEMCLRKRLERGC
jgi:predicted RNA binding protein YcfA (HicA-like mRNA interferase family)